ncbi:MAG: cytochrome c biogenesis protein CcsA [Elusimicrobia bacterium]|nr:cytochrome c biogenesis protein CcsA [Elusimicrobiota bacterium]
MIQIAFQFAFGFSLLALGTYVAGYLLKKPSFNRWVFVALFLSWLEISLHLLLLWRASGHAPLSNQYESMMFLLWTVLTLFVLFYFFSKFPLQGLVPALSLFLVLSLGVTSFLDSGVAPLVPALQSNWLLIHVITTMIGYAALSLGFLGGVVYWKFRGAHLDEFLYRAIQVGFWFLALGIITGAVWANSAWGTYWSWDPKETWALVTWLFYAIAIHLRRTRGWKNERFAWLAIAGFVFVVFTYFGVNYLLSGLHAYA